MQGNLYNVMSLFFLITALGEMAFTVKFKAGSSGALDIIWAEKAKV